MKWLAIVLLLLPGIAAAESYYAELNDNNVVLRVVVINELDELGAEGAPSEDVGVTFCQHLFNGGRWVKTYTDGTRKNYAGPGFTYDPNAAVFIPPKPFPSWIFDRDTALWASPAPHPTDGKPYRWNEQSLTWDEVVLK